MIIWLASYPKSGNTWLRFFINSLLYAEVGKADLINIANIKSFPKPEQFINLVNNINDIKEISENWTKAQSILNLDKKIKFIKTHNMLCKLNGNFFTNLNNTLGTIYIVRDPRNVVNSIKHHFQLDTLEKAKDFITSENTISGTKGTNQNPIPAIIGSWKTHYNSWKRFPKNLLILNYDKILLNPNKEFLRVKKFLEKILKLKINKNKFNKSVENCEFEKLQKMEKLEGFVESIIDKNSGKKKNFFNLGPKNDWKNFLDKKIKDEIENKFEKEMKELNYL
tara:strand:+ start:407 stop:1246 length:840 start_codon:yes stop_codon:yes gene_type:complete